MQLSFVIPCRNSSATLEGCLDSVFRTAQCLKNFEVIVVNNASTDDTANIALRLGATVIEAFPPSRSLARNKGIEIAKFPWIAFIDSDVILDERWAFEMLLACEQEGCAGGQGAVIPATCYPVSLATYRSRSIELKTQKSFSSLFVKSFESPMVNTAACLYRREALEECGGFDLTFTRHEDIDLSKRICRNGWSFRSVPSAQAEVQWSKGSWGSYLKRAFWVGHYKNDYNKKWFEKSSLRLEWRILKNDFKHLNRNLITYRKSNDFFWLQKFLVEVFQKFGKLYSFIPYLLNTHSHELGTVKPSRLKSRSPHFKLKDSIRLIETPPTSYLIDFSKKRLIDLNSGLTQNILILIGWKPGSTELVVDKKYEDFLEPL